MIKQPKALCGLCFLLSLFWNVQVSANDKMTAVLEKVNAALELQELHENKRLAMFVKKDADKTLLLLQLKEQLEEAAAHQVELLAEFEQRQLIRAASSEKLTARSEQLSALFAFAKQQAKTLNARLDHSFSSARYPERQRLLTFANSPDVPQLQDLKSLWQAMVQELTAKAGVQSYTASVIDLSGATERKKVLQIGDFVAIDETGHYLKYLTQHKTLQVMAPQSDSLPQQAQRFFNGSANHIIVDPLKGKLLDQLSRVPDLEQRMHQGGLVGYIILGLGAVGLLIALWRVLYMAVVNIKLVAQLKTSQLSNNNPLGRVLKAVEGVSNVERAELLIDQAMLQEIPKLERCHSLVKLLAAVAPLLGLLGTVTGMIETFQSITLLGTSDPKLMAGGISQALITTVMGLCVAIPLLFSHSFISAKSQRMLQLIQQQSLGLLSEYFVDEKPQNQPIVGNVTATPSITKSIETQGDNIEGVALA